MPARAKSDVVGVDTGGTFTDLVRVDRAGKVEVAKLASTPHNPARAVLAGLANFQSGGETRVVHGTTVGLNALLSGNTARTALVTGRGFADLIEIGRQDRPELYALHPVKPKALVPRELRFEVGARQWPDPDDSRRLVEVEAPDERELAKLREDLAAARVESVAVCLLHSYADPRHEERVARALASLGVPVTTSSSLVREYREFERFSTAVVNAALAPMMRRYLETLARELGSRRLELLQSTGGKLPAERAAREPVRVLLSGPAGGVVGASRAAAEAGWTRLVSLDMGGTSTDVAFEDLRPAGDAVFRERSSTVAGHPLAVPALDIHTIGCGGGSLVHVDAGGALHVGPESAGADPGPVCYGRSDRLTVTDAHALLGHLGAGRFLGGTLELDLDGVARAFEKLARKLSSTTHATALAVLAAARASMRRAISVMTMQRGIDPRSVPLVAFGGAGGLHALDLARAVGMPAALVPMHPGALSALGLATARAQSERARSVLARLEKDGMRKRAGLWKELEREVLDDLATSGVARAASQLQRTLHLRYEGQSYDLAVPESPRAAFVFEQSHERLYGYRLSGRAIELVAMRARGIEREARQPKLAPPRKRGLPIDAVIGERAIRFESGKPLRARRIDRAALVPGVEFDGPAIVEEFSGTSLIPPGVRARVTAGAHLELRAI
ncbi:MAG TPA: hydantoinase/oxoprolinase family protein [Planctomycetota bacterium]|nr:hydantoinase/oxoprolinase family protein [Planctomycetota bacterium]